MNIKNYLFIVSLTALFAVFSHGKVLSAAESKSALLATCAAESYRFTPKVRAAYLAYAKAQALADLKDQDKSLPDDFMVWVEADPLVEATIYGAHHKPSDLLLHLFALYLDLGKKRFEKYHQLALASAMVSAKQGQEADISPRPPLKLAINGDPRKLVDTKEPGRKLDMNDHIINFLNDNTIEEDVVVGHKEVLPELKYDDRGIAIPVKKKKRPKKVPVIERQTRTLYAADIIASTNLQNKFNGYMKARGQDVQINCGERIIHWKSRDMVRGQQYKDINAAYLMFRGAYEAKGLLPEKRDPFPTAGERCAYLIRNNEYKFSAELQKTRKWPRFPLTAPWPVLTMLAADKQPLRECEERWDAFRTNGIFKTYGEYIGSVAQQHPMQSARRLKPYPFTYSTIQMMLKDGGVCGTMGNISARSHNTLGIPACTAGQPGHCAMVAYRVDAKTGTYLCKGGQYATGGDSKTTPHAGWFFGDDVMRIRTKRGVTSPYLVRKPMIYHQCTAWAVNYGMDSFLDSLMVYNLFHMLPEEEHARNGVKLLARGMIINPYNFLLPDTIQREVADPQNQISFWRKFQSTLVAVTNKPGCPADGLYNQSVKKHMFARINALPVPLEDQGGRELFAFLEKERCDNHATLVKYRLALDGMPALLIYTEKTYQEHLKMMQSKASRENDSAAAAMAATLKATAGCISNGKDRKQWALSLLEQTKGGEKYFGHRYRVATDASVTQLARLAGKKMPPETELVKPVINRVSAELTKSLAGDRSIKECRQLAAKIQAVGNCLKDAEQKREWVESLLSVIAGHESFKPQKAKKDAKPLRDPCADTINKLHVACSADSV